MIFGCKGRDRVVEFPEVNEKQAIQSLTKKCVCLNDAELCRADEEKVLSVDGRMSTLYSIRSKAVVVPTMPTSDARRS